MGPTPVRFSYLSALEYRCAEVTSPGGWWPPPEITLVVGYCQEYGLELIFTVHASHIRLVGRLGSEVRVSTDFQIFSRGKLRGRISPGGYLIDSQYGVNVVILSTSSKIWGPGQHLGACAPQVPYCKTVPALKLIRCYLIKLIQY